MIVESIDVFEGGFLRTIGKGDPDEAGRVSSVTLWDKVRLAQSGEIMDALPYEVGDKITVSVSKN